MNRLAKIENFCYKIGIFSHKNSNELTLGPFGYLLLNQIKTEWIRTYLAKFNNSYLIDNKNLLKNDDVNKIDLNAFLNDLGSLFYLNNQPIGLVNVFDDTQQDEQLEYNLFKNKKIKTNLNFIYLNFSNNHDPQNDLFSRWQRERLNWWSKIAHYPEHLSIDKSDLIYKFDEFSFKNRVETFNNANELENYSNFSFLKDRVSNMVISKTTCESVLENVLVDSVEFPEDFNVNEKLKKYDVSKPEKTVFHLDFRLSPYKACILYKNEHDLKHLAYDYKNIFYMKTKLNLFVIEIKQDESDLQDKYDHLDMIGVPYAIYLPSTISKDGLCYVRSRDTSLSEQIHLSLVAQQLNEISNALIF